MDADRFETFLRSLSAAPSRRRAAQLLAGLVLGSLAPLTALESEAHNAVKRCKKLRDKAKRKKCLKRAKQHTALHNAQDGTTRPFSCVGQANGTACGPGPSNQCCGGVCVDTATDEAHCGACGTTCLADETCDGASGAGVCCIPPLNACDLDEVPDRCCGGESGGCAGEGTGQCTLSLGGACGTFCSPNSQCSACTSDYCDSASRCACQATGQTCPSGCAPNAVCGLCCDLGCGGDGTCCVATGRSCPMRCQPNQACATCCAGQCGGDDKCCDKRPLGGDCLVGTDCCSGNCQGRVCSV